MGLKDRADEWSDKLEDKKDEVADKARDMKDDLKDKLEHRKDEWSGKAKEAEGRATGDTSREYEGKLDKAKGNLGKAGEKVKDAFKS